MNIEVDETQIDLMTWQFTSVIKAQNNFVTHQLYVDFCQALLKWFVQLNHEKWQKLVTYHNLWYLNYEQTLMEKFPNYVSIK